MERLAYPEPLWGISLRGARRAEESRRGQVVIGTGRVRSGSHLEILLLAGWQGGFLALYCRLGSGGTFQLRPSEDVKALPSPPWKVPHVIRTLGG